MDVQNFVGVYKNTKDKNSFLSKHLKCTYINYEEKISYCQNIVNSTMYSKNSERTKFRANSPLQYVFFSMTLINLYFDVDIEFGETILVQFNELNKNGLIDSLLQTIPEREFAEFDTVFHMVIDDLISNERDIASYIDNKIDLFELVINSLKDNYDFSKLSEVIEKK